MQGEAATPAATRTTKSLAAYLARVRFDDLTTQGVTRLLTRSVVEWAESLSWLSVTEMAFTWLADTPEQPRVQGYVDVFIARPGYKTDLVIEIDSTNKVWSAQKLGHAAANGRAAIWIRWRTLAPAPGMIPPGVEMIYLGPREAPRAHGTHWFPAAEAPDLHGLSGPSRALLAALYPLGVPDAQRRFATDETLWQLVDVLSPRTAEIVKCRFGRDRPRPFTLARTAEVVAEATGSRQVTRERIRQIEKKALRQLRSKAAARRVRPQAGGRPLPVELEHAEPASTAASRSDPEATVRPPLHAAPDELFALAVHVIGAAGGELTAGLLAHVLRGSHGPQTMRLVTDRRVPHHGALPQEDWHALRRGLLALAEAGRLELDGRSLRVPTAHVP